MTTATGNVEMVRSRLATRRDELRSRLTRLDADQRREADPLSADADDQAIQTENDEVIDSIGITAQAELVQIDAALRQLEAGHYGMCTSCGHAIESTRLAAIPYATRCIRCTTEPESRTAR